MARSDKKKPKNAFEPGRKVAQERENPESIMSMNPSWSFSAYDKSGRWAFSKERLHDMFWDEILPKLTLFEKMTWGDILIASKKQNHTVEVSGLNKVAQDRLSELGIFRDELVSLRLNGTLRVYGYLSLATLVILWVDDDHGDNQTCVYRSKLKYT